MDESVPLGNISSPVWTIFSIFALHDQLYFGSYHFAMLPPTAHTPVKRSLPARENRCTARTVASSRAHRCTARATPCCLRSLPIYICPSCVGSTVGTLTYHIDFTRFSAESSGFSISASQALSLRVDILFQVRWRLHQLHNLDIAGCLVVVLVMMIRRSTIAIK